MYTYTHIYIYIYTYIYIYVCMYMCIYAVSAHSIVQHVLLYDTVALVLVSYLY